MKIAIAYDNGGVADASKCSDFLVVHAKDGVPTAKEMVKFEDNRTTTMLTQFGKLQIDVLICSKLGVALRNALEMMGVLLVPGVSGAAEEAAAKFLVGEAQGDPSILEICREDDPNDPMACMHDCSKCAGCAPINLPEMAKDKLPKV